MVIENKMIEAVENGRNWKSSNTEVWVNSNGEIYVYLFGNNICRIKTDGTRLFSHCGWKTITTKSRLNALGADIHQRNGVWYNGDGSLFENDF